MDKNFLLIIDGFSKIFVLSYSSLACFSLGIEEYCHFFCVCEQSSSAKEKTLIFFL